MSKAHGVLAYYCLLEAVGYIDRDTLFTFKKNDPNSLLAEPNSDNKKIFDYSIGPLGTALPLVVGMNLSAPDDTSSTCVLLSDAEMQKGQNYEALNYITSHETLKRIIIPIIDFNDQQIDGDILEVSNHPTVILKGLGFEVLEVDGHNTEDLEKVIKRAELSEVPSAIVAHTVKGNGIPEMINNPKWHYYKGVRANVIKKYLSSSDLDMFKSTSMSIEIRKKARTHIISYIRQTKWSNGIALSGDLNRASGIVELKSVLEVLRFPMSENLLFKVIEGLTLSGRDVISAMFESLFQIVVQELYSLQNSIRKSRSKCLILSLKPGISSDDGPSMRNSHVLSILLKIPNLNIICPKDLEGAKNQISQIQEGCISILRVPDYLPKNSSVPSISEVDYQENLDIILCYGFIANIVSDVLEKYSHLMFQIVCFENLSELSDSNHLSIFKSHRIHVICDSSASELARLVKNILDQAMIKTNEISSFGDFNSRMTFNRDWYEPKVLEYLKFWNDRR